MKQLITILVVGAAAALLGMSSASAAAQGSDPSEDCAMCHEEIAADFQQTIHSVKDRGGPTCITCHGSGNQHMEEGGDPAFIRKPAGRDGEELCRTCHQNTAPIFSNRSAHADASVWCGTCHKVHASSPRAPQLLAKHANDLCADCHPATAGTFNRPYGHSLDVGGLQCVSCHNPHGGSGPQSLRVDRSGESPCLTCHTEKLGPFVFPHVAGVAGDCMTCHQPHGSSNPMALTRSRVDQLCLECHSFIEGGTFGSQPPSFHDLRRPRYQNCTTCHVAIHGSNASPLLLK